MLTKIEPIAPKAKTRFELALDELETDLRRAFDERISDFELDYEGMKASWIREKVRWLSSRKMWIYAIHDLREVIIAKYPGICLFTTDNLCCHDAFIKVRIVKDGDGSERVVCHMEHDIPLRSLKKTVERGIKEHNQEQPDEPWEDFDWKAVEGEA